MNRKDGIKVKNLDGMHGLMNFVILGVLIIKIK